MISKSMYYVSKGLSGVTTLSLYKPRVVFVWFSLLRKTVTFISSAPRPANPNTSLWRISNLNFAAFWCDMPPSTSTLCSFSETAWLPVCTHPTVCALQNIMLIYHAFHENYQLTFVHKMSHMSTVQMLFLCVFNSCQWGWRKCLHSLLLQNQCVSGPVPSALQANVHLRWLWQSLLCRTR